MTPPRITATPGPSDLWQYAVGEHEDLDRQGAVELLLTLGVPRPWQAHWLLTRAQIARTQKLP